MQAAAAGGPEIQTGQRHWAAHTATAGSSSLRVTASGDRRQRECRQALLWSSQQQEYYDYYITTNINKNATSNKKWAHDCRPTCCC